jgi:hypothetical protein
MCWTSPANATRVAANATHVQTRPKMVIPLMPVTWPTVKLHAAYMPSGNTVAHRRTS